MHSSQEKCPNCSAELKGEPIPLPLQDAYGDTHFSRKIGIYSVETDRTVAWKCPDCNHQWDR